MKGFLDQNHITICISQSVLTREDLQETDWGSIYTNKDCLAISARKLSANIQLSLSHAEPS